MNYSRFTHKNQAIYWLVAGLLVSMASAAGPFNGFKVISPLIPADEIFSGGPPKDGIPSINNPNFIIADQADFLTNTDRVLGITLNGVSKAYPIAILNWHEIVNDQFGEEPIVISYCPLCGTGIAFNAMQKNKPLTFGVSGLLYNSDVLLYDHGTESLWSQILQQAISGPLKGTRLSMVKLFHTTWSQWLENHPNTQVLSKETGYNRDYQRNPYMGYEDRPDIYFPISHSDNRFPNKEWVVGIEINQRFKAYPFSQLKPGNNSDTFNQQTLSIVFDPTNTSAQIFDAKGNLLPSIMAYWFAWAAFHPDTAVYQTREHLRKH